MSLSDTESRNQSVPHEGSNENDSEEIDDIPIGPPGWDYYISDLQVPSQIRLLPNIEVLLTIYLEDSVWLEARTCRTDDI